jgi:hypothetical protein
VVGMARAAQRSAGIEGGVTCLGPRVPRVGAPPNVVGLCDFVLGVLETAGHGVCVRACNDESAAVGDVWTLRLAEHVAGMTTRSAGKHAVRRPGVHQKGGGLLAWMKGQIHSFPAEAESAAQMSFSEC